MIRRGAADRRMSMCNEMECKREETQRRQKGAKGILGGRRRVEVRNQSQQITRIQSTTIMWLLKKNQKWELFWLKISAIGKISS
jgi:hypothetical protein